MIKTFKRHVKSFVMRGGICSVPGERTFLFRHLETFAKELKNKRILDVGAGLRQYRYLFDEKNIYESCDLNGGFHQKKEHNIVANIYDITVESHSYDVILLLQVLEHLEFPVKALKEVNRILKDDGILFLSAPQAAGDHFEPQHYFNYTQYGLKSVLGQAGFEILKHHRLDGMFVYIGNRIGKLGTILYDQYKWNSHLLQKLLAMPFFGLCWILGAVIPILDPLDKLRNYCIGHIVIAQKRKDAYACG